MPKSNLAKKTQQYSLEFKRKSVEMTFDPDVLIKDVALAMDIHPFMLSRWRKEYREGLLRPSRSKKAVSKTPRKTPTKPKYATGDAESLELKRLRKENDKLKLENDLLKIPKGHAEWQRYLSVVMDKYSRNIISWRLSEEKTAMLTRLVLRAAIEQRNPPLTTSTTRGVCTLALVTNAR